VGISSGKGGKLNDTGFLNEGRGTLGANCTESNWGGEEEENRRLYEVKTARKIRMSCLVIEIISWGRNGT